MTDYEDFAELALDIAETGSVLLTFESKVGQNARFGYYRGSWCLVIAGGTEYSAQKVDREAVYDALHDSDSLNLVHARHSDPWQWLVEEGTNRKPMFKSHCMCGDFRYSTDINDVYRWRNRHKDDCYYDPNIQHPDDD